MSDLNSGYVRDLGYTFGYYSELNPARMRQIFLRCGLAFPEVTTACELGYGQGLSVNVNAAASPICWFGTDFNASHAAFAQELAAASGAGARLFEQGFDEFCRRSDLPDFDFVGLHGIWSWVSDETRAVLVDFLRRKLKIGGVVYLSYNTQPGWAWMDPMRELLTEHKRVMSRAGDGMTNGIEAALAFTEKLIAAETRHTSANPQLVERLRQLGAHDRSYLAHEFFNRDWAPMSFSRIVQWLKPAQLSFAGSANYIGHIDEINLTAAHQALLDEIQDPTFRQHVRDFCINEQFRRDYWIKGPRALDPLTIAEAQRAQRFILVKPRADVSLKVAGALGEGTMREDVYAPVLDALSDHAPKSLGELEALLVPGRMSFEQLGQVVLVLTGAGTLVAVQDDASIEAAREPSARLNAHLCKLARSSNRIECLASPVTGGGAGVSRFAQLFLLARAEGKAEPAEWAAYAWEFLAAQGEQILKDGVVLEGADANLAELTERAHTLATDHRPVLKAIGVA